MVPAQDASKEPTAISAEPKTEKSECYVQEAADTEPDTEDFPWVCTEHAGKTPIDFSTSDDETTSKSTACLLLDSPVSEAEERLEMTEREIALVAHDDFDQLVFEIRRRAALSGDLFAFLSDNDASKTGRLTLSDVVMSAEAIYEDYRRLLQALQQTRN
ncbi:hypothetical protein AAVH_04446 [Aphelenchoides avenae]|nr:hypothetical protein AAVH_04446 [Aphelenchus avenae]